MGLFLGIENDAMYSLDDNIIMKEVYFIASFSFDLLSLPFQQRWGISDE